MKITTKYGSIERQIFEFDENDIREAVIKYANIVPFRADRRVEFEWGSDEEDRTIVRITLIFEKETGATNETL